MGRGGSGLLYAFDPGLRVTVRDLLAQMIVTSDNTATDMMLERVGGLDALNAWLKAAGTPLGEALEKALPLLNDDNPNLWLGSMTARETARLLEALEGGRLAGPESTRQMMAMLAEQRSGQLRLPHYLPWPDYAALHKTGDGPPAIAHDVGIIFGPNNQKIVIAFFSAAIAEPYAEHEDRIGRLARAVVDHLDPNSGR